jgi:hypothetical protein
MGGGNESTNLVKLPPKAHFVVYHLLCKIYPNNYKLTSAFNLMCVHTGDSRKMGLNSRLFEIARIHFSKNHPMKNPEVVNRMREKIKQYWDKRGRKPIQVRTPRNFRIGPKPKKRFQNWNKYQKDLAVIKWSKIHDSVGVQHVLGYPICGQCGNLAPTRNSTFCSKNCFDNYQRINFKRTPEQHAIMVENIKKFMDRLTPEDHKKRLDNSLHSDKVDHVKRGKKLSEAKRGKSTNQYEIMGRRFANMSESEFILYLDNISNKKTKCFTNLRLKWKKILQLEN